MIPYRVQAPTLRVALLAGFGLTVCLWLTVGYLGARRLADAGRESAALDARYTRAQDALSAVRSAVLLTSVIVRDALLDTRPRAASDDHREIAGSYAAIDVALTSYAPVIGSADEIERLERLKREVATFRQMSAEILATDSRTWQADAQPLLRRYLPSRERAIAVSEEAQAINRALYVEQRRGTVARQSTLQSQMWTGLGIGLAMSLVIAWLALRYATRLERRLLAQYTREEQIGSDLHKLSARLIDVQEEEQRRIARELHDEVGQGLNAVQLELAMAQKQIQRAGVTDDLLQNARIAAEAVLRNVRNLSQLLHPSVLEDLGLSAALGSYVKAFSKRSGIDVDLVDQGPAYRVADATERTLYRIVQEALNNVLKHAEASRVFVRLSEEDGQLVAVIEDNGSGFDAVEAERPGRRRGLGLLGIRERVAQLGGSLRLETAIGHGTRLEIALPTGTPVAPPELAEPFGRAIAGLAGGGHG